MQRSSESIAALAAALAKAQAELVNPEKTQVANLEMDRAGTPTRSFRYASLSSGLDIVRKTLSQQAIAVIQTTAVDQTTSTVKLTTMLAHASGEWVASDWPICAIEETATPHRMGAALTYARRYALFTLVGIAGEDDIDAPDLAAPRGHAPGTQRPDQSKPTGNGAHGPSRPSAPVRRNGDATTATANSVLPPDASQALRDMLLKELADLTAKEAVTAWAHKTLPAKNRLIAAHAQAIEEAFLARFANVGLDHVASTLAPVDGADNLPGLAPNEHAATRTLMADEQAVAAKALSAAQGIDKGALAIPEPRRIRDRDHIKFVASQPCLICGRQPVDAHHLRFAQRRALGRKVSDEFTVPLCRGHHRALHRAGDEAAWWQTVAIDPVKIARKLWKQTRQAKSRLRETALPRTAPAAVRHPSVPG